MIALTSSEIIQLQTALDQLNLTMYSLPLRQHLWYIQQGIIQNGQVYVDQWPQYRNICCLNTSDHIISKDQLDFDLATFYCLDYHPNDFEYFLSDLASIRGWNLDRSFYGECIPMNMMNSFRRVLKGYGRLHEYPCGILHSAVENENIDKYRQRLQEISAQLPDELISDSLGVSDVDIIIRDWIYAPMKVIPAFFKWLLEIFPSTCLRKKQTNELVAWACSYNVGGIGHVYVTEEYRGRGLSEFIWLSLGLKLSHFSPVQPWFEVAPSNMASNRSAEKAFSYDHKIGDMATDWFYFFSQAQSSE